MARRRPARRPARGGGGIQALRRTGPRVGLALGSAAAYGGVVAWSVTLAPAIAGLVAIVGGAGVPLLALVLWRGTLELLPWALVSPGAAYAVALEAHAASVESAAPLVAAALLLCGELAAWSLDERWAIAAEGPVVRRRAGALGGLVLAGLAAASLLVAVAAAPAGEGLAWTTLGAAAAVGVVAGGAALAQRGR